MTSRPRAWILGAAALGAGAVACNAILGIDQYSSVDCAFDCGVDAEVPDVAIDTGADATLDVADATPPFDARRDAPDAPPDAPPDVGFDAPPEGSSLAWAQWRMPNPVDAAIGPEAGADARLPNPESYVESFDAGADGSPDAAAVGPFTVRDKVTNLTWTGVLPIAGTSDRAVAAGMCSAPAHLPTRIQLVTLLDFTQSNPMMGPKILRQTTGWFWTQSAAGSGVWMINFLTGEVLPRQPTYPIAAVLCVTP